MPLVLVSSTELLEEVSALQQRATDEDAKLNNTRSLRARVGVALGARVAQAGLSLSGGLKRLTREEAAARDTFLSDLVREWDPNRDGAHASMRIDPIQTRANCV